MADYLSAQGHTPVFVDNNSTYEPLLEYYETCPYRVIRLPENQGNTACWTLLGNELPNNDYFVISDADYLLDGLSEGWAEHLREGVDKYGGQGGCGLSMLETKIPSQNPAWKADEFWLYPDGNHPARWGTQVQLQGGYIRFPVDTSFAMYPPGTTHFMTSATGIRSGEFSVRHLPWHIVLDLNPEEDSLQVLFDEEYYYYLNSVINAGTTCMTGTTPRMTEMIAEYERRTGRR
jgi:hypothetical protein